MRILAAAAALVLAPTAALADPSDATAGEAASLSRQLSAIWRPLPSNPAGGAESVFAAACEGADRELDQLAAALPAEPTPAAVAGMRSTRGLVLIPGAELGQMFVFPSPELDFVTGGLGGFAAGDAAQGLVALRDGAQETITVRLGRMGGRSVLRIERDDRPAQDFVGCAATLD